METAKPRLAREDWILAGFRALTSGGVSALKVETVARELNTTKGSFYWHFADPADWRTAMLTYWEDAGFHQIVASVEPMPRGLPRLLALAQISATKGHDAAHGGIAAEAALRDWARYAPDVAKAVARVDKARIAFVESCFADMAFDDPQAARNARLFYATLLGLETLKGNPEDNAKALGHLVGVLQDLPRT